MTKQELCFRYNSFKKLSYTEENVHLRRFYEKKAREASLALRTANINNSDVKASRTPWKRMNIKSGYYESCS